jgi:small-conductance mechanosensitive channel
MKALIAQIRSFLLKVIAVVVVLLTLMLLFEQLSRAGSYRAIAEASFVVVAGGVVLLFIRRFKSKLTPLIGAHASTILTFIMGIVASIVVVFAVLRIYQVPPDTLLLGGGIITIVVGLAVSTLVGNIISSTLMLTAYPFRVGDSVVVNNIPGTIEEVTPMFTRIRNNTGTDTVIPNTAIISGGVTIAKTPANGVVSYKLPYAIGDRIYTNYIGGEGTVAEISPFLTRVQLDEGREIMIPNSSVLTGVTQVAKILQTARTPLSFSLKVDWDPEGVIRAIRQAAESRDDIFKKSPEVQYASVEGNLIQLTVICEVETRIKGEARSVLLRAAYLSRSDSSAAR